jgi:hypothetical protein
MTALATIPITIPGRSAAEAPNEATNNTTAATGMNTMNTTVSPVTPIPVPGA